jgi:hypothetical protein
VDGPHEDPVLAPLGAHSLLRQVNREARAQAMRHQTRLDFGIQAKPPGIFANLQTDTIWVVDFAFDTAWQLGRPLLPWKCKQTLPRLAFSLASVLYLLLGPHSGNKEYTTGLMVHLYEAGIQELTSVAGSGQIATCDNIKLIRIREGILTTLARVDLTPVANPNFPRAADTVDNDKRAWAGFAGEYREGVSSWLDQSVEEKMKPKSMQIITYVGMTTKLTIPSEGIIDTFPGYQMLKAYANKSWEVPSFYFRQASSEEEAGRFVRL